MKWLELLRKRASIAVLSAGLLLMTASSAFAVAGNAITATITPAGAITYGAQWSIDGGTTWRNSATTATPLAAGTYTVTYKAVPGYTAPANQTIVLDGAAATVTASPSVYTSTNGSQTTSVSGFVQGVAGATMTVNIYPYRLEANLACNAANNCVEYGVRAAGAQWSLDGGMVWHDSGATVSVPASYTITFGSNGSATAPTGWRNPADITGTAAVDETISHDVTYKTDPNDYDNDGRSDILFRNFATGHLYDWTMSLATGTTVTAGAYLDVNPGTSASPGNLVAQADFNGDGQTDLLFQNQTTGDTNIRKLYMYIMNGAATVSTSSSVRLQNGTVADVALAADEIVAGVADFNADGYADILVQRYADGSTTSAQWRILFMKSFEVVQSSILVKADATTTVTLAQATGSTYGAHTGWHVAALTDLNNDSKADIVLRFANSATVGSWTAGLTKIWYMDGATRTSAGNFSTTLGAYENLGADDNLTGNFAQANPTGWQIAGVGDFNGDGWSDFLLRHGTSSLPGKTVIWFIEGNSSGTPTKTANGTSTEPAPTGGNYSSVRGSGKTVDTAGTTVSAGPYSAISGWQVAGIGDFDADDNDDILWRYKETGHTYVWAMQGRTINGNGFTSVYPGAVSTWKSTVMRSVVTPQ